MHCRRHKQNDMREQERFERDLLFFSCLLPEKSAYVIERKLLVRRSVRKIIGLLVNSLFWIGCMSMIGCAGRKIEETDGWSEVAQAVNRDVDADYTSEPQRVALTFDDGPHPIYTPVLLDGLKERNVRATFFLIGENIPGREEIVRRIWQEGHRIGNHTYHHVQMPREGALICGTELDMTNQLIREITGETPEIMRPPFGQWSRSLEEQIGMIPVSWDVDPLDWETPDAGIVADRILSDVENGDIILLHDSYATSVEAALRVIDVLQAEGMEFVTAEELLFD